MNENMVFSDEELEMLGARTLDVLLEAIEAGDGDKAAKLAKRMYAEFQGMHDFYRDWLTDLFSHIGWEFGDKTLASAMEGTVARFTRRLGPRYQGKSPRRRMEVLCAGLRGHLQPMKIEEDDEKFTIISEVCGSGGRQVKDGMYEGPEGLLKVKEPQPMSFNRPDFPVYCVHCYFANSAPLNEDGSPMFICEPAEDIGNQACRMIIHKKGVWAEES